METISRLRSALLNALGGGGSQYAEQEVFEELRAHRTRLRKVFDVGIRNSEHQREIESGMPFLVFQAEIFRTSLTLNRENRHQWKTGSNQRRIRKTVHIPFSAARMFRTIYCQSFERGYGPEPQHHTRRMH